MITLRTASELEAMGRACAISARALQVGGSLVRAGATTGEIDDAVHAYIVGQGAKPSFLGYSGYPKSTNISINEQVIHGIPDNKTVIREGDLVSIDVGAFFEGYHGDNAATFFAGAVSREAQKLADVTREALAIGIAAARPGNRVGDIGAAVQRYVEENGFSVIRDFVGHGVGRALHEEPEVPNFGTPGHGPRLLPGMVIAIEPMVSAGGWRVDTLRDGWTIVTRDGSLAAHFEHTIAVTDGGPVILTKIEGG